MTQEYLSRKIVTAWRADRPGDIPEGAPEGSVGEIHEGYGVKYHDGYTSWCPRVKFEEDTLPLGNVSHLPLYQQRLLAETVELNQRSGSLGEFLESAKTNPKVEASMSARGFELLKQQHVAMEALLSILDQRIEDMSDTSGIAALLVVDPLLDAAVTGTIEELQTPVIDRSSNGALKLGGNDEWLREKLAQMTDNVDRQILAQWGHADARVVEVQVPVSTAPVNVLALLPAGSFDHTDTIGTFGVKAVVNATGEPLSIAEGKVINGATDRDIEMTIVAGPSVVLDMVLNKETGTLRMYAANGTLEGATMTVVLWLHNLNRRPAQ